MCKKNLIIILIILTFLSLLNGENNSDNDPFTKNEKVINDTLTTSMIDIICHPNENLPLIIKKESNNIVNIILWLIGILLIISIFIICIELRGSYLLDKYVKENNLKNRYRGVQELNLVGRTDKVLKALEEELIPLKNKKEKIKSYEKINKNLLESIQLHLKYCRGNSEKDDANNTLFQFPNMMLIEIEKYFSSFNIYQKWLSYISMTAPSLGFLGTVVGLIGKTGSFETNIMSNINNALITTFCGLFLMLITSFAESFLESRNQKIKNRLISIIADIDEFMYSSN